MVHGEELAGAGLGFVGLDDGLLDVEDGVTGEAELDGVTGLTGVFDKIDEVDGVAAGDELDGGIEEESVGVVGLTGEEEQEDDAADDGEEDGTDEDGGEDRVEDVEGVTGLTDENDDGDEGTIEELVVGVTEPTGVDEELGELGGALDDIEVEDEADGQSVQR